MSTEKIFWLKAIFVNVIIYFWFHLNYSDLKYLQVVCHYFEYGFHALDLCHGPITVTNPFQFISGTEILLLRSTE